MISLLFISSSGRSRYDLVAGTTLTLLTGSLSNELTDNNTGELGHIHGLKESLGLRVNLNVVKLEGRLGRDIVILALTLFLLELEADTTDGSLLDAAHQVGGEPGNLVAEALARNDSNLAGKTLVGLEIEGKTRVVLLDEDTASLLNSLCADTTL